MCDDPSVPCDVGHMVNPSSFGATERAGGLNVLAGTRKRVVMAHPTIGDFVPTDGVNSVVADDPSFSCTDITQAIYDQMPGYRASKTALTGYLAKQGAQLL